MFSEEEISSRVIIPLTSETVLSGNVLSEEWANKLTEIAHKIYAVAVVDNSFRSAVYMPVNYKSLNGTLECGGVHVASISSVINIGLLFNPTTNVITYLDPNEYNDLHELIADEGDKTLICFCSNNILSLR